MALVDIDEAAAEAAATAIGDAGGTAHGYPLDVRDAAAVQRTVDAVVERHGSQTILVNCVGIAIRKGLLETTPDEWEQVIATNLTGCFHVLRAVVPAMTAGGAIVQVASIAAHIGYGYRSYTAAKGGVLAMTRQLASELAPHGIRINSVSPGVIETGLNRDTLGNEEVREATVERIITGRLGTGEDVASAILFLAHPGAEFVNGADLVVDGGMTTKIHWGAVSSRLTQFHQNR